MDEFIPIPPEPGLQPAHLEGPPADPAEALGPHASGRAVWGVSHARFAVREAIRLLDLNPGDEVLIPAFCCNTVSAPVRAAGAVPVLCRVRFDAQPDWDDVAVKARSPRARALIAVHYLGFPADLEAAQTICQERGLVLVEDCAHALYSAPGAAAAGQTLPGGLAGAVCENLGRLCHPPPQPGPLGTGNRPGRARPVCRRARTGRPAGAHTEQARVAVGQTADLAIFSIRKTLPTVVGGALTVNPDQYPLPAPPAPEPEPDSERGAFLRDVQALYTEFDRAVHLGEMPEDPKDREALWAQARRLYAADTEAHALPRISRVIMGHADREAIVARRRANYERLAARLGEWALYPSLPAGVCPLGFPVLVEDREAVKQGLDEAAIGYLLHWSRKLVPAHGVDVCPAVAFLADHVMTLPIHQDLEPRHLDHLAARFTALGVPPARGARRWGSSASGS